jgi:hypothetical protein
VRGRGHVSFEDALNGAAKHGFERGEAVGLVQVSSA